MSAAAATSVSHRTARTSSVLSQFHAAHTARIFASTRLMIAAVLTHASATPQSALTSVNAHAQRVQLPVSSIPTAAAQFRSASQSQPLHIQHTLVHTLLQTTQHQLHTSGPTQPRHHHASQRPTVLSTVTIMRVMSDHMVIAGHQLIAHTASVMPMAQASAPSRIAPHSQSARRVWRPLSRLPVMAVARLLCVSQLVAIAQIMSASSHHQHASTTRIASPLHTMTAVPHTPVSATSHSVARSSLPHVQRDTSDQSSRLMSAVQLLDALSVHQTTQPLLLQRLLQLSHQQSMSTLQPRQQLLPSPIQSPPVLVTPRTVRLDTTVRSGQLMPVSIAAVLLSSQLSAQRSSVPLQLHAQRARSRLVNTRLMSAVPQFAAHQRRTARSASMSSAQRLPSQHVSATRT
jgi:hypothetical protein